MFHKIKGSRVSHLFSWSHTCFPEVKQEIKLATSSQKERRSWLWGPEQCELCSLTCFPTRQSWLTCPSAPFSCHGPGPQKASRSDIRPFQAGVVMKWACFLTFSPHPRGQRRESWSLQWPCAKLPDQNHLHWSGLWDRKKSLPVKHRDLKAYLLPQLEQILTNTLTSTDFFKRKPYKQFMSSSFPGINN